MKSIRRRLRARFRRYFAEQPFGAKSSGRIARSITTLPSFVPPAPPTMVEQPTHVRLLEMG